MHGQQYIKSC